MRLDGWLLLKAKTFSRAWVYSLVIRLTVGLDLQKTDFYMHTQLLKIEAQPVVQAQEPQPPSQWTAMSTISCTYSHPMNLRQISPILRSSSTLYLHMMAKMFLQNHLLIWCASHVFMWRGVQIVTSKNITRASFIKLLSSLLKVSLVPILQHMSQFFNWSCQLRNFWIREISTKVKILRHWLTSKKTQQTARQDSGLENSSSENNRTLPACSEMCCLYTLTFHLPTRVWSLRYTFKTNLTLMNTINQVSLTQYFQHCHSAAHNRFTFLLLHFFFFYKVTGCFAPPFNKYFPHWLTGADLKC